MDKKDVVNAFINRMFSKGNLDLDEFVCVNDFGFRVKCDGSVSCEDCWNKIIEDWK